MHDGRFATLEQVIEHYAGGGIACGIDRRRGCRSGRWTSARSAICWNSCATRNERRELRLSSRPNPDRARVRGAASSRNSIPRSAGKSGWGCPCRPPFARAPRSRAGQHRDALAVLQAFDSAHDDEIARRNRAADRDAGRRRWPPTSPRLSPPCCPRARASRNCRPGGRRSHRAVPRANRPLRAPAGRLRSAVPTLSALFASVSRSSN